MKKLSQNKQSKSLIIWIVAGLLVVAGGFAVYAVRPHSQEAATTNSSSTTSTKTTASSADATPDTPDDAVNDGTAKTTPSKSPSSQPSSNVSVVVVDASQYNTTVEVRAYTDITQNGTCTFTFTNDSAVTITKQTSATINASTSSCATLDLPSTDFTTGNWNVTVSYASTSGTNTGTSASQTITIK